MDAFQPELPLAFPAGADVPLLPARMVNEFVYCPRLAYLEWVQGEWADSADTVEGRHVHRRTEGREGVLPQPADGDGTEGDEERIHARSVTLASETLGVIAKLDLVEGDAGRVVPVDYKRGKRPHVEKRAHAPERVQIGLQILLLREHGFACEEGILYFAASRERVHVPMDAELEAETHTAVTGLRLMAAGGRIPPPLSDSPKCVRCSLNAICLPDEVAWLRGGAVEPRPLAAAVHEALPLVVQANGARIGKSGHTLTITVTNENEEAITTTARLAETSQVVLMGSVTLTTPALHELMRREIPVSWYTSGGWFLGHTVSTGHKNVELRTAQYRASFDDGFCLRFARGLVAAKIVNARTLIRRNAKGEEPPDAVLDRLARDRRAAEKAPSREALLGIEGTAAARAFSAWPLLLRPPRGAAPAFDPSRRSRRPPADPVNALLSFLYAMLARAWTVQLSAVGLDPYRGFYHQPRYGRPALALDMMEPYRPLLADSVALQVINTGEVAADDFTVGPGVAALKPNARKTVVRAFERRLSQEITHPLFGYRISYRRLLEVQARLLGRHLTGEIADYPHITPR